MSNFNKKTVITLLAILVYSYGSLLGKPYRIFDLRPESVVMMSLNDLDREGLLYPYNPENSIIHIKVSREQDSTFIIASRIPMENIRFLCDNQIVAGFNNIRVLIECPDELVNTLVDTTDCGSFWAPIQNETLPVVSDPTYYIYEYKGDSLLKKYIYGRPHDGFVYLDTKDECAGIYSPVDVDKKPEFPGGDKALTDWLEEASGLTKSMYEITATEKRIPVFVLIKPNGRPELSDADYKKLVERNAALAPSLKKLIEAMPEWEPGKIKDKAVTVRLVLNFKFE